MIGQITNMSVQATPPPLSFPSCFSKTGNLWFWQLGTLKSGALHLHSKSLLACTSGSTTATNDKTKINMSQIIVKNYSSNSLNGSGTIHSNMKEIRAYITTKLTNLLMWLWMFHFVLWNSGFVLFSAVDAGIAIVNEVGLDPGIDHMLAMECFDDVKAEGGVVW